MRAFMLTINRKSHHRHIRGSQGYKESTSILCQTDIERREIDHRAILQDVLILRAFGASGS